MSEAGGRALSASDHNKATVQPRAAALWLLGLTLALLVLLASGGEPTTHLLRYERAAIFGGELWRLVTGHLVHGSTRHLLLNCGGLLLIGALFSRDYSAAEWLFIAFLSMAVIDLGFVFYEPQLMWYVGISGVLHGALAAGAASWWERESRPLALAWMALLIGKLVWEQMHGALPLSGDLPVVVDAHLYGALGGALAAALLALRRRDWPFRRRSL